MAVSPEVITARQFRSPTGLDSMTHGLSVLPGVLGEVVPEARREQQSFNELLYDPSLDVVSKIYSSALPQIIIPNPRVPIRDPQIGAWQILASGETGQKSNEFYTTPFGRDLTITMLGLVEAVEYGATELMPYVLRGITALEELESYQAMVDDPARGVMFGQIPHELRFATDPRFKFFKDANWPMTTRINEREEEEEVMINYDSSEATQLYVLLVMKIDQMFPELHFAQERQERIDAACEYMLRNSSDHDGLAGFTNDLPWDVLEKRAEGYAGLVHREDPTYPNSYRTTAGLEWREARDSALHGYRNGFMPKPGEPIHGLQTTAIKFAAELEAADYYERIGETTFAQILRKDAQLTKIKTNSTAGFLQSVRNGLHFVEAIGVNPETNVREPLPYVTASPLYALAFNYVKKDQFGMPLQDNKGRVMRESVIDDRYLPAVVDRLMTELFDERGGLATYASDQVIPPPRGESHDGYWIHRDKKKTLWFMEQNLAAKGMIDFGFIKDGLRVGVSSSRVIEQFGTPIENCELHEDGRITRWELPDSQGEVVQSSGHIQAFTMGPGIGFIAQVEALRAELTSVQQSEYQFAGQSLYLPAD